MDQISKKTKVKFMSKINSLRELLALNNVDVYIIPKNDQYFQEHANPDRLGYITNFKGSSGVALLVKIKIVTRI